MMKKIHTFYPTLKMAAVLTGIFFVGTGVASVVAAAGSTLLRNPALVTNPWVTLTSYLFSFLFVAGFICLLPGNGTKTALTVSKRRMSVSQYLLLLVFTPLLGLVIEPLTSWLPMPDAIKELFAGMTQQNLPTFLLVVIAAPVLEEWLCRGVIAKGLLRHSTPAKAILWSAFLFAFIHLNPWQAVPAFIIGAFLGYIYWKTQSLWPCIFIHFVNNGLSYLTAFLLPDIDADASFQAIAGTHYLWIYPAAAVLAVACGYLLYRTMRRFEV